jgi:hypothetical protein
VAKLTARGTSLRWHTRHNNLTEQPAGSNTDRRRDGIRAAQVKAAGGGRWLIGQPWCGVWALMGALAGGVRPRRPYRWASVALLEDDARAGVNGFRSWAAPTPINVRTRVLRADVGVLFGRGVHVETVRKILPPRRWRPYWLILTNAGNTTAEGKTGSQSNGGQSARRRRALRDFHGFALVDFPNR